MDDRYGRPLSGRMGKSRPGPENRFEMRQEACATINRGSQKTEGPGMAPRAVRGTEAMKKNLSAQRKPAEFFRRNEKSPYLANDLDDERRRTNDDMKRFRFYGNGLDEMRNRCLDTNRYSQSTQKKEEYMGYCGPQKQKTMQTGMGERRQQEFEERMGMKNFCDYKNRRTSGPGRSDTRR